MTRIKIRLILLISLAVALLALVLFARHHWITQGEIAIKAKVQTARLAANAHITQIKKDARHETQSLDRDDITRRLCDNGWVRDRTHCPN